MLQRASVPNYTALHTCDRNKFYGVAPCDYNESYTVAPCDHDEFYGIMPPQVPPFSDNKHLNYLRRQPLGVCALITP